MLSKYTLRFILQSNDNVYLCIRCFFSVSGWPPSLGQPGGWPANDTIFKVRCVRLFLELFNAGDHLRCEHRIVYIFRHLRGFESLHGGFSGIFVVLSSKTCGDSQSFLHTASQSSHNTRDGHSLGKK